MTFLVGEKVECIRDLIQERKHYPHVTSPVKGGIYTVRDKELRGDTPGIRLVEITNPVIKHRNGVVCETCFADEDFRSVKQ